MCYRNVLANDISKQVAREVMESSMFYTPSLNLEQYGNNNNNTLQQISLPMSSSSLRQFYFFLFSTFLPLYSPQKRFLFYCYFLIFRFFFFFVFLLLFIQLFQGVVYIGPSVYTVTGKYLVSLVPPPPLQRHCCCSFVA